MDCEATYGLLPFCLILPCRCRRPIAEDRDRRVTLDGVFTEFNQPVARRERVRHRVRADNRVTDLFR